MLKKEEVQRQSEAAYSQWKDTWDIHAKFNAKILKEKGTSCKDLLHIGAGRSLLCCGNGPSFEDKIDDIKERSDAVDIASIDKCFGKLLDNGIKPQFVFLADAGIDYETWCKPWIEQTEDILLITNVTANIEWIKNWKGQIYFYVNKDNIQTEKRYTELSGCYDLLMASSNVGNTVVVFANTYLLYDEYFLIGYDFAWGTDDNYYAFKDSDKRYWMGHVLAVDRESRLVSSSQNLLFSGKWLADFYQKHKMEFPNFKMFSGSKKGIISIPYVNLKKALKLAKERNLPEHEKQNIVARRLKKISLFAKDGEKKLKELVEKLLVHQIDIYYIPTEVKEWLLN